MLRTLVISPNWIGDAVMAQPLLRRLKELHPDRPIDVLAPTWVAPVWQAMREVERVPGEADLDIGRRGERTARRQQPQGALCTLPTHVQAPASHIVAAGVVAQGRAVVGGVKLGRAGPVRQRREPDLAAEHVALQPLLQVGSRKVGQHRQEAIRRRAQQGHQRDNAALGGEPSRPLPAPGRERTDVVHQLRLQESLRIGPFDREQPVPGKRGQGPGRLVCLERHGAGT